LRVLFRVEANADVGLGHSMRCLGLAQHLMDQGHSCHLVTTNSDDSLLKHWHEEATKTDNLTTTRYDNKNIKVGSDEDASLTLLEAGIFSADWIVLDNYSFDFNFQTKLANNNFYLLYLDDYLKEYIGADLVLNQNCQINSVAKKNYLTGADYFLANRKLYRLIKQRNPAGISKGDILVTFGGSDPDNLGLEVVQKLFFVIPENEHVHLAFSSNQYELLRSEEYAKSLNGRLIIHNRTSLVDIYPKIRFAICAGGVTTLELASLGIVSGILVLADNQEYGVSCLDNIGAAKRCNSIYEATNYIAWLLQNPESSKRMSMIGINLIDGKGVERVYRKMQEIMDS